MHQVGQFYAGILGAISRTAVLSGIPAPLLLNCCAIHRKTALESAATQHPQGSSGG